MMQPGGGMMSTAGWGISLEWSEEEQRILETHMVRFPAERVDPLQRYVRIAAMLPRKTVRDVALRIRWTNMQAQLKRRTGLDPRGVSGLPPMAGPKPIMPMVPPMGPGSMPPPYMAPPGATPAMMDGQATIEGPISHLLDANLAILNHFRSNMAAFKVHENTQLLVQFRDNILQILQAMEAMGGVMAEMPALPVRLNQELANSFLPSRPAGVMSYDGMMMMPPPPQPALNAPGMVPINGPGFTPGGGGAGPPTQQQGPSNGPGIPQGGPQMQLQAHPKPPGHLMGNMPPPPVPQHGSIHQQPQQNQHQHTQQHINNINNQHSHPSGHPGMAVPHAHLPQQQPSQQPGSNPQQGHPQQSQMHQQGGGGGGGVPQGQHMGGPMRLMAQPMQQQQQQSMVGSAPTKENGMGTNPGQGGGQGVPQPPQMQGQPQQQQQQGHGPMTIPPAPQNQ